MLDPFMGAGATLVAARQAGRRAVGYDLDARYVELARARVTATIEGQEAMLTVRFSSRLRTFLLALVTAAAVLSGAIATPPARASADHPDWDEWDLLRLTNRERWEAGLAPLGMSPPLRDLARSWSAVMAGDGQLRHDPNLTTDIQRVVPSWLGIGENVGYSGSVAQVQSAFMGSPDHRKNVLNPDFTSAGVGVAWRDNRLWVTVKFVRTSPPLPTITRTPVDRFVGSSDVETALSLSRLRPAGSARAVVVAREDQFADALAGGPLAAVGDGPLLLSPSGDAPATVVAEARRVLTPTGVVQLLGGPNALSAQVQAAFTAAGMATERIAGPDRFTTATLVSVRVSPAPPTVFLVSGLSFPDAVSAAAPAAAMQAPILLLAAGATVDVNGLLSAVRGGRRIVVGGPAAVSEAQAAAAGATERIAGPDRFGTSAEVARRLTPNASQVVIASGLRFQDALVAGPEAARRGAPVVLTAPGTPRPTYDAVAAVNPKWSRAVAVGTPASVPDRDITLLFS